MNDRGRREPSADIRKAASQLHELYIALRDEGFSEQQALTIIGQGLAGRGDGQ